MIGQMLINVSNVLRSLGMTKELLEYPPGGKILLEGEDVSAFLLDIVFRIVLFLPG